MKRVARFVLSTTVAMASASCAPSRAEMASPVEEALQERLQRNARWRGADAAKDRAVDDNVSALLKRTLTMKSAVEIALVRNPAVQVAYESLGLAQADLVDAGLLDNPRLDLSLKAPVADPTGTAAPELGVGVELPFLSVLFIAQRTSIAEARRDAARARVVDVVVATAADARRAFVDAVTANVAGQLALQDVDAAETAIVVLRANTAAGNQTALELAEEEARYQEALLNAADVERAARVAREALHTALGLFGADAAKLSLPMSLSSPKAPDTSTLERDVVANNLQIAAARADLDSAANALGYASAKRWLPDLDIGVEAEFSDKTLVGPTVGIGLPITNLGQGEILRRESEMRKRAAVVQQAAIALRARSRQAAVVVDVGVRRVHQIDTMLLPRHVTIVDEVERRLNGMLVFPTAVVSARRGLFAAQQLRARAVREAWHARIDIDQLVAGGTPGTSTIELPMMSSSSSSSQEHD